MKKKVLKWMTVLGTAGLLGSMQAKMVLAADGFSFEDVAGLEFCLNSNYGGLWGTKVYIYEDGSFEGSYYEGNEKDTGEGYSDGTLYLCNFSGQFADLEPVNSYTYSAKIMDIKYENMVNTYKIKDEIRYVYLEPYGLDDAENLLFYLEGAPLEELPEAFRSSVRYSDLSVEKETELSFIGLYNEAAEESFSSSVIRVPGLTIDAELAKIQEVSDELQANIRNLIWIGGCEQIWLNQASIELKQIWEYELNSIWNRIKARLPEKEMKRLISEELDWITEKEKAIAEARAECEEDRMRLLAENTTAAELTQIRAYELAEYLR
ncbi:MAG: lysozyme inhibitor LprI family protein [Lachnospiraceae bacterium]|nr:lysozyme inhibitor LprI family protein [Robinsoniella sp.]MDY3767585.1 lysozyme inhibitor LprI family protein [Lachnospiraceae bacterium]